jgi:hypothetical protein
MATYSMASGTLNLTVPRGTELVATLDFSDDTTGYTVTSEVYSLVSGTTLYSPSVSVVSATAGQHTLTLTEANTEAYGAGSYGLRVIRIAPGTVTRRLIAGILEVQP